MTMLTVGRADLAAFGLDDQVHLSHQAPDLVTAHCHKVGPALQLRLDPTATIGRKLGSNLCYRIAQPAFFAWLAPIVVATSRQIQHRATVCYGNIPDSARPLPLVFGRQRRQVLTGFFCNFQLQSLFARQSLQFSDTVS